jgi:hypothetical protein
MREWGLIAFTKTFSAYNEDLIVDRGHTIGMGKRAGLITKLRF